MAAPAFRAAGTLAHNTVGVTPGAPSGLVTDDIELLVCESMDEAISLATANGFVEVSGSPISVPSGTATIATRGALFWRRYAGEGSPTTNDPGNHILAQRYAFSGCATTGNPWDFIQTSSEATEDTSGSATGSSTTGADRLIAIIVGAAKPDSLGTAELSGFTNANLTSLTERADNAGNSGNGGHVGLATGVKASAADIGATTYTKATSAYKWHFVVALKPPSGQTVAVGLVTETDTAQATAKLKQRATGLITETDTAQVVGKTKLLAVGQVTENDQPSALSKIKTRAVALVTETDSAPALVHQIIVAVGLVVETNAPQAVAKLKQLAVGLISETDMSQTLGKAKAKVVGLTSETSAAQSLTARKVREVAQAVETNLAQTLGRLKQRVLGQTTETDTAQSVTAPAGVQKFHIESGAQALGSVTSGRSVQQSAVSSVVQVLGSVVSEILRLNTGAMASQITTTGSLTSSVGIQGNVSSSMEIL